MISGRRCDDRFCLVAESVSVFTSTTTATNSTFLCAFPLCFHQFIWSQ